MYIIALTLCYSGGRCTHCQIALYNILLEIYLCLHYEGFILLPVCYSCRYEEEVSTPVLPCRPPEPRTVGGQHPHEKDPHPDFRNNKTQNFPKSEISNETTCMNQCDICKKNYYNYSQLGMKSNRLKHFLQEQAACNWRWTCKWFLEDQERWFERENNSPTIKGKASDMGFKGIRPSMKLHNISFSGK